MLSESFAGVLDLPFVEFPGEQLVVLTVASILYIVLVFYGSRYLLGPLVIGTVEFLLHHFGDEIEMVAEFLWERMLRLHRESLRMVHGNIARGCNRVLRSVNSDIRISYYSRALKYDVSVPADSPMVLSDDADAWKLKSHGDFLGRISMVLGFIHVVVLWILWTGFRSIRPLVVVLAGAIESIPGASSALGLLFVLLYLIGGGLFVGGLFRLPFISITVSPREESETARDESEDRNGTAASSPTPTA